MVPSMTRSSMRTDAPPRTSFATVLVTETPANFSSSAFFNSLGSSKADTTETFATQNSSFQTASSARITSRQRESSCRSARYFTKAPVTSSRSDAPRACISAKSPRANCLAFVFIRQAPPLSTYLRQGLRISSCQSSRQESFPPQGWPSAPLLCEPGKASTRARRQVEPCPARRSSRLPHEPSPPSLLCGPPRPPVLSWQPLEP